MSTPQQTSVRIRVQARGGKYLGPNVNYAQVSVLNDGNVIFGPALATGNSGTVDSKTGDPFVPSASRAVIALQPTSSGPPSGAYWLLPSPYHTAHVLTPLPPAPPPP